MSNKSLRLRCRDGVRLAADLYLPDRRGARLPTVLVRTPYGKAAPDSLLPHIAGRLTEAGYAVVVQDVRGCGDSSGATEPFVHELYDAADTLDWLITQPFSDGQVACWGNSYYGFTAWAAAATGHPAVRAVVSRYTSTRPSAFTHDGGVLRLGPMAEWMASTWGGTTHLVPALDWSTRPLGELFAPSRLRGLRDDSGQWHRTGRRVAAARGEVPTLHCVGWFDFFQQAQLADWRAAAGRPDQFLIAAASDHMDDVWSATGSGPDHLVDDEARGVMLDRILDPVIDFLDAVLRGTDRRFPCIHWELTGADVASTAHASSAWPPVDALRHTLRLSGAAGGMLVPDDAQVDGTARWLHDPDDLVPMVGADWWRPLLAQGDARPWAARDDVRTFSTSPLDEPLELAGPVELRVSVGSTAPLHHIVATLCEVAPDGTSHVILQAARRLPGRHHEAVIPLGDTAFHLLAGHCLRLHLASSCFPFYLPHSGTDADPLESGILVGSRQELDLTDSGLILTTRPGPAAREAHT